MCLPKPTSHGFCLAKKKPQCDSCLFSPSLLVCPILSFLPSWLCFLLRDSGWEGTQHKASHSPDTLRRFWDFACTTSTAVHWALVRWAPGHCHMKQPGLHLRKRPLKKQSQSLTIDIYNMFSDSWMGKITWCHGETQKEPTNLCPLCSQIVPSSSMAGLARFWLW